MIFLFDLPQLLYFFLGAYWLTDQGPEWIVWVQAISTYIVFCLQADSTHERVVKKEDGERLAKVRLKYEHIKHHPDVTV